jgi:hypothetical protein
MASTTIALINDLDKSMLHLESNITPTSIVDTFDIDGQIATLSSIFECCFQGSNFQFISLQKISSAATTLSLAGCSDLDLVLIVKESDEIEINRISISQTDRKSTEIEVLTIARNKINELSEYNIKELVTEAKVPVLKLTWGAIDVSMNNKT